MLVPGERLLFWASALVPIAIVSAFAPQGGWLLLICALAVAAVAAVDGIAGRHAAAAVSVRLPDIVRLTRGREGTVTVTVDHPSGKVLEFEVGLPLPRDVGPSSRTARARTHPAAERSRVEVACTPVRKGRYEIDTTYIECASPLDFWRLRRTCPASSEIRVYPNLLGERRKLAAVFLGKGWGGIRPVRTVGQGREFEQLRNYIPGDSYGDIAWKATAKRGHPVTKLFQVQRTQEVIVAIDASRLSGRPMGGESTLDYNVRSALLLGQVAQQQGDRFGLLVFSDRVDHYVPPGTGPSRYSLCREALTTLTPSLVSPDYRELFAFIRARLRRRALVVVLTDLSDRLLAEQFRAGVDLVLRRHILLVAMLCPDAMAPVFSQPVESLDEIYEALGHHLAWNQAAELKQELRHIGVGLRTAWAHDLSTTLVSEYMAVKARQLL